VQIADSIYSTRTLLSDLSAAEIFVVMLIRLRVAARLDPESVPEDWRSGMRAAGVSLAGVDAFEQLMHLLGGVCHLPLDIRSLRCGGLGQGEALLLHCVSLLQADEFEAAERLLGRWLPPGTSRIAARQAQRFACALAQTHLHLEGRQQRESAAAMGGGLQVRDLGTAAPVH
jgi:hypothetical protein